MSLTRLLLVTVLLCPWGLHGTPGDLSPEVEAARARTCRELCRHQHNELAVSVDWFQQLVEWALSLRSRSVSFAEHLKDVHANGKPLDGADLEVLRLGTREHLALRREIRHVIERYQLWMPSEDRVVPPLIDGEARLKGVMTALAGALVLYDNFAFSIMVYQDDGDLRRLINRADPGYGIREDQLLEVLHEYNDSESREAVQEALDWIDDRREVVDRLATTDPQMAWLDTLIRQSPSRTRITKSGGWKGYLRLAAGSFNLGVDKIVGAGKETSHTLGKAFGNTVGLIAVRDGKLGADREARAAVRAELRPLDVLLEKTPFRLTDKLIPGHFGHVAIWTGTPGDLKALGLWDDPLIVPHQEAIIGGARVLEALRDGVQLRSLESFMDVDDLAILRCRDLTREGSRDCLRRAMRQLGKEYDFNFDVETTDRIVCSELAYHVFTHVPWPTENTLGRATISPDNVALKAVSARGAFELVMFWHDGRRAENPRNLYSILLNGED